MSVFGNFRLDRLEWDGPVLVVPGLHGSGQRHWQSIWERRFPHFVRVQQDDWDSPDLDRWARRIVEAALQLNEPALVIAHSFGCLAAVRAETFQSNLIAGALLVAPANPERFGVEHRLPRLPLLFPSTVAASGDDPWMPLQLARQWAEDWGSAFVDVGRKGHINADSGLGEWAEGQELADLLCRRMSRGPVFAVRPGQYAASGFAV
ncbi:MAG: alpha/beta hydrolase [Nevskia sp.]|nr:alpha/beta hydrolase [Nevskia sp.]